MTIDYMFIAGDPLRFPSLDFELILLLQFKNVLVCIVTTFWYLLIKNVYNIIFVAIERKKYTTAFNVLTILVGRGAYC